MATNKLIKAQVQRDYTVEVWFKDGKHGVFDMKPFLKIGDFSSLTDIDAFNAVRVDYGTLVWSNELDIAPDTIETEMTSIE